MDSASAVEIIGGGPAGCAAALSARHQGAPVRLYETSAFPRHKVCGEFLSPEVPEILGELGVLRDFEAQKPARLAKVALHFGARTKSWTLREPAWGLSRYALDELLLRRALAEGAALVREPWIKSPRRDDHKPGIRRILGHGRKSAAPAGARLFGFKAHFAGTVDDVVHLFFFSGCYIGVTAVENGITYVCGVVPEPLLRQKMLREKMLRQKNFEIESLLEADPALRERVLPLARTMKWLITGPLVFGMNPDPEEQVYRAGDALGFVDPFTGSGISAALVTGKMAGEAAARSTEVSRYVRRVRAALKRQYFFSSALRMAIRARIAEKCAGFIPGRLLFELTRPANSL